MARLGCAQGEVTRIICDNQWSISFPKNSSHNACKQYINVHYHFILDKLEIGIIQLDYSLMENMVVDVLTNSLAQSTQKSSNNIWLKDIGSVQIRSDKVDDVG